jgi:hypothetical protein
MMHAAIVRAALLQQGKHVALIAVAAALAAAALASVTYDTDYVDASGARCASFVVGSHEIDLCRRRTDR